MTLDTLPFLTLKTVNSKSNESKVRLISIIQQFPVSVYNNLQQWVPVNVERRQWTKPLQSLTNHRRNGHQRPESLSRFPMANYIMWTKSSRPKENYISFCPLDLEKPNHLGYELSSTFRLFSEYWLVCASSNCIQSAMILFTKEQGQNPLMTSLRCNVQSQRKIGHIPPRGTRRGCKQR